MEAAPAQPYTPDTLPCLQDPQHLRDPNFFRSFSGVYNHAQSWGTESRHLAQWSKSCFPVRVLGPGPRLCFLCRFLLMHTRVPETIGETPMELQAHYLALAVVAVWNQPACLHKFMEDVCHEKTCLGFKQIFCTQINIFYFYFPRTFGIRLVEFLIRLSHI